MYVCLNCGYLFEKPKTYKEPMGPPGEPNMIWSYNGCPECGEPYAKTFKCALCGEYIIDKYIRTADGVPFCENCYVEYELGEEY